MHRAPYLASFIFCTLTACGDSTGDDTGSATDHASTDHASTTASADTSGSSAPTTDTTDTTETTDTPTTGAPPELDPALAECLRINACEADGGAPMGLQTCLAHALDVPWTWAATGPTLVDITAMDCKLAAADCEGVRACTPALSTFEADCADQPGLDLCAGSSWVVCDPLGAPLTAIDCAAAGLACGTGVWSGCGLEPCEYGVTESSCDGDVLVECAPSGFMTRVDCPTQYNYVHVNGMDGEKTYSIAGETCGLDVMRNALGCIGTGADCGFFSQSCDGATLETCAGGKLARRDCAALEPGGQGCGFIQSGPFAGAASCGLVAPACDLSADESCAAGQISFCDWDTPGTVDCLAAGFTGCATTKQGARTVAYCTP